MVKQRAKTAVWLTLGTLIASTIGFCGLFSFLNRDGLAGGDSSSDFSWSWWPRLGGDRSLRLRGERATSTEWRKKQTMVLHVGLPKTGSTYLQCVLSGYNPSVTREILLRDNFVYLGRGMCGRDGRPTTDSVLESEYIYRMPTDAHGFWVDGGGGARDIIASYPGHSTSRCSSAKSSKTVDLFEERVNDLYDRGHNGILLFETLAGSTMDQIHYLHDFLTPNWKVIVVINYRPFYSWLPSYAFQQARHDNNIWPGRPNADMNRPFDVADETSLSGMLFNASLRHGTHYAQIVRERYASVFGSAHVAVVPMQRLPKQWGTQGNPLLGHFFCRTLQGLTPHTCHDLETDALVGRGKKSSNVGFSLNYHFLADGAYEQGYLKVPAGTPELLRKAVIQGIQHEQENNRNLTVHDFPVQCMSDGALDALHTLSLEMEQRMFPQKFNPTLDVQTHMKGFRKMVESKQTHCHIDVTKTLRDRAWQSFFQRLVAVHILLSANATDLGNAVSTGGEAVDENGQAALVSEETVGESSVCDEWEE